MQTTALSMMGLGLLLFVAAVFYAAFGAPVRNVSAQATSTPTSSCASDTFTCPDGSKVERIAPSCDFAECAYSTSTDDYFKG